MSKVLRSPPGNSVHQVSSENDITNLDPDIPLSYVSKRMKRPRQEDQEENNNSSLLTKEELLTILTQWKKDQDVVLNRLSVDIAELKEQNSSIKSSSMEVEKSIQFISKQYEEMKIKLLNMEQERKENLSYIASLENQIEDLQKRSKSAVVEVRNLPVSTQQNRSETQQDLCDLMQKTCGTINVDITKSDIKDIYRIKNKTGSTIVVTELTSVLSKNKILDGVKEYNKINPHSKLSTTSIGLPGPRVPIYITESLTNKDRKLFGQARDTAKISGFKFCWTNRGRIYMRQSEGGPRIEIKTEENLKALKKA
ncbi:uncharacterized protein LOC128677825 [Plodia interpunctella]|uniref:uncharacterized protein LOC128671407 n=1 Tax=Plodia interpunctella TaxID=58824 RepID=UPI002368BE19|nr:uncharacterized protein LOC128671407 [Plodia interpunctella]XP_053607998.1 uncharacterized protein LOC128673868 [Plodia interpunctella]XP_053614927.1 uncharacterized protein LOC128677825 [Plodia interpunctella]